MSLSEVELLKQALEVLRQAAAKVEGDERRARYARADESVCAAISALEGSEAVPGSKKSALGSRVVRVVAVDDDKDALTVLAFFLKKKGIEITCFENPMEALGRIPQLKPDLVLLDLMMPEMSGFEFLEKLKSDPAMAAIKVVVGSGRNYVKDRLRSLEMGAADFIDKPYDMHELLLRIQKCVS